MTTKAPPIRLPIMLAIAAALVGCALSMLAARLTAARTRERAAEQRLVNLQQDIAELTRLRARSASMRWQPEPEGDVSAAVQLAAREAALPAGAVASTSLGQVAPLRSTGNGPHVLRRELSLSLRGIDTADLGRFLEVWHRDQPLWTPTRIDLTADLRSRDPARRYAASLTLTALYASGDGS